MIVVPPKLRREIELSARFTLEHVCYLIETRSNELSEEAKNDFEDWANRLSSVNDPSFWWVGNRSKIVDTNFALMEAGGELVEKYSADYGADHKITAGMEAAYEVSCKMYDFICVSWDSN